MQFLVNGFISGGLIALVAIAFQSVYLPTRVFFIALAGIYALAPYISHTALSAGGGWFTAVVAVLFVSVFVSVLCEWLNHALLAKRQAAEGSHLITSLGIYIVLLQIITMIWGTNTLTLRTGVEAVTTFGDVVITTSQWIMLGTSVVLIGGFAVLLLYSEIGLRLRALAENPTQFGLFGYNVDRYRLLAFSISGIFVAASALTTAHDVGFNPYSGLQPVLLAVVAVIVGGRNSFAGPVVAAILLGMLRSAVIWNFSPRWQDAMTFALLMLFLLFRPQGLLGQRTRIEVAS